MTADEDLPLNSGRKNFFGWLFFALSCLVAMVEWAALSDGGWATLVAVGAAPVAGTLAITGLFVWKELRWPFAVLLFFIVAPIAYLFAAESLRR